MSNPKSGDAPKKAWKRPELNRLGRISDVAGTGPGAFTNAKTGVKVS